MSRLHGMKIIDTAGTPQGLSIENGCIRNQTYLHAIAEGDITAHTPWSKIGYTGAVVAATESDLWSAGGLINFPTAATAMAVIGGATDDATPALYSGTATGGTTTSLIDTGKNFTTPTRVAVGDCVILDKSGTTPECGYVTGLTGTNQIDVAGGFSSGGDASGKAYFVLDEGASVGAHAVKIEYLDATYATKSEIVILNGAAEVNLVASPFRINSFRVIAAGSTKKAAGALSLKAQTPTATVYSYITAGFTRARNIAYTVPLGKTLFVTSGTFGYAYSHNSTHYARIYTKANCEPSTGFLSDSLFYPYSEFLLSNSTAVRDFEVPTKLIAKTDIRVSVLADYAGIATCALRGWLE